MKCKQCSAPHTPRRSRGNLCPPCAKARDAKRAAARTVERREKGLCEKCGLKALTGTQRCSIHSPTGRDGKPLRYGRGQLKKQPEKAGPPPAEGRDEPAARPTSRKVEIPPRGDGGPRLL